jgi:hypothetical protein
MQKLAVGSRYQALGRPRPQLAAAFSTVYPLLSTVCFS